MRAHRPTADEIVEATVIDDGGGLHSAQVVLSLGIELHVRDKALGCLALPGGKADPRRDINVAQYDLRVTRFHVISFLNPIELRRESLQPASPSWAPA